MKKLFLLFPYLFFLIAANAQMPKTINYQAVARNAAGQPLTSKTMKVRLSILNTASNSIYSETRTITTNVSGLFNIEIGSTGALSTTGNFKTINWTKGNPKKIKTELDVNNTGSFTDMGTQNFTSVPYAFSADEAVNATKIGGNAVDTAKPNTNDVLKWNGNTWARGSDAGAIINTYNFTGQVPIIPAGTTAWTFIKAETIDVSKPQTLTASFSAAIGSQSGAPDIAGGVSICPCYQQSGGSINIYTPPRI